MKLFPLVAEGQIILFTVSIVSLFLNTLVVLLRFVASSRTRHKFGRGEWVILGAWVFAASLCALIAASTFTIGVGWHEIENIQWVGDLGLIETQAKFSLAIFEILGGGLCLVKLSMLLVISAIFTVRHVRVGAADFYGCFLPVSCMWGLDIPARRKAGLIAMFSVESPTCIVSLLRAWKLYTLNWADAIQVTAGVCLACVPFLRPLFVGRPRPEEGDAALKAQPGAANGTGESMGHSSPLGDFSEL